MNETTEYLGDGVYGVFSGYDIELKLGDHRSETVVYLDKMILTSLITHALEKNFLLGKDLQSLINRCSE